MSEKPNATLPGTVEKKSLNPPIQTYLKKRRSPLKAPIISIARYVSKTRWSMKKGRK